jgi:hypothetical protein
MTTPQLERLLNSPYRGMSDTEALKLILKQREIDREKTRKKIEYDKFVTVQEKKKINSLRRGNKLLRKKILTIKTRSGATEEELIKLIEEYDKATENDKKRKLKGLTSENKKLTSKLDILLVSEMVKQIENDNVLKKDANRIHTIRIKLEKLTTSPDTL